MSYRSEDPDYREARRRDAAARHAHEVHRAYRAALGEEPGPAWEDLPAPAYPARLAAVEALLGPDGDEGPEARHNAWAKRRIAEGWRYGDREDRGRRLSPCLRPWDALAPVQRAKDALWLAAVWGMLAELREREEPEPPLDIEAWNAEHGVGAPVPAAAVGDEDALAAAEGRPEQGSDPPVPVGEVAARLDPPVASAPTAPLGRAERRRLARRGAAA